MVAVGAVCAQTGAQNEKRFGADDFLIALTDAKKHQLQIGAASDTRVVLLKPRGSGYYIWEGASQ